MFDGSTKTPRRLLTVVLAAVFLLAGTSKLFDLNAFAQNIEHFRMLPPKGGIFMAAALPWLEVIVALALFVRPARLTASLFLMGLMIVFSLAVGIALARGLDISCGCFGKAFEEYAGTGSTVLLRDILLTAASAYLFVLIYKEEERFVEKTH